MTNLAGFRQINEMVEREARFVQVLDTEIRKAIIGQDRLVERALVALLADGHILLEGVPGLAKTLLVKTIGQAIQAGFSRIQFTPDLLPADLIGTRVYNPRTGDFSVQKGPVFSNLILADEVNRAPAKVQSALLEAMQKSRSRSATRPFRWRRLSWFWLPRTPSSKRAPTPCRRPRSTGSCSRSLWTIRSAPRSGR